jgi:hypothetical protein
MSIRYTISCDEFLECCEDRLPKPSVASFVAMLLIAIATGVFGVVLTYAVDPGSKLLASTFCWLSIVLLGMALWDLKIRSRQCRDRLVKEYRAIHDRLLKDEFTFDFDSHRFTFESAKGKGEVPWEGVLRAVEMQNVIALGNAMIVPKRVLEAGELEKLRQLAIPGASKACLFHVGFVDYVLTETASLWRRHPFLMTEAHAGGLLFFCLISFQMLYSTGPGVKWGWMIAFAFLFLTITGQFWYFLIKYRTTHVELRLPRGVEFSARGLTMTSARVDWFGAWQTFPKFRETRRAFLLYIDPKRYHLLPKACLTQEQQTAFRQILEAKLVRE